MVGTIEVLVPGGKANPGPPLDLELGPVPVDVQDVINDINDQTVVFGGMEVPVIVGYDDDGLFSIEVGVLPTATLIKDEVGFDTGNGEPQENFAADMSIEQLKKVAEQKPPNLLSYDLKNASEKVAGTYASLGVIIEGEDAHTSKQRIDGGNFGDYFDDE